MPSNHTTRGPARHGFTLVELMIVLVIVGILTAVAFPSLREAYHKSRRSDAMAALGQVAQAQERWRANNPNFHDSLATLPGIRSTNSPEGHYTLSLVENSVTATGYTVQATASSQSTQASDSRCQVMQLRVNNGRLIYESISNGAVNAAPDPCWVR